MGQIIHATFQNGAFVPDEPVSVAAGTRVTLTVEEVPTTAKAALASHRVPTAEDIATFNEFCDRLSVDSGGERMTRDELHERS